MAGLFVIGLLVIPGFAEAVMGRISFLVDATTNILMGPVLTIGLIALGFRVIWRGLSNRKGAK